MHIKQSIHKFGDRCRPNLGWFASMRCYKAAAGRLQPSTMLSPNTHHIEMARLRTSENRGWPLGDDRWIEKITKPLWLSFPMRNAVGRKPRKAIS